MARESKAQQATVGRVMHAFKHGELDANGRKVRNPRQAIAIGLSEAGASRTQSPAQNGRAKKLAEGEQSGVSQTRAELYAHATKRGVAGRSRMTKAQLARALAR